MRYEVLFMFKDKAAEMTLGAKALRIDMETAFHILRQRDSVPKGMPWSDDFPEVVNHTSSLKARNHRDFEAAKHGDFDAAIRLVDALVSDEKMDDVVQRFPFARIAYIHCKEGLSTNMIPAAYAARFSAKGMVVEDDIVAVNSVRHTQSSDLDRLSRRLRFDGEVTKGADYIVLDDFITTGAELRDMRDYISCKGGNVVMITTLGHGSFGQLKHLGIDENYKEKLKMAGITDQDLKKYGIASGIGCLTLSEAARLNRMVVAKTNRRAETIIERLSSLREDHADVQEVAREGAKEMTIKEEQNSPVRHFRR